MSAQDGFHGSYVLTPLRSKWSEGQQMPMLWVWATSWFGPDFFFGNGAGGIAVSIEEGVDDAPRVLRDRDLGVLAAGGGGGGGGKW